MTKVNLTNKTEMNQSETMEVATVWNQTQIHEDRTSQYSTITTNNIVEQLKNETELDAVLVAEEKNRVKKNIGFGTHLVRCTVPGINLGVDGISAQMYIRNSYHGRTKFEMHIGLFDSFNLRGFFLGNRFKFKKIKHIGLTAQEVQTEVEKMKEVFTGEIAPFILSLQEAKLNEKQQLMFAELALKERVRSNANFIKGVNTEVLLQGVKVDENKDASIWDVFQMVQENLGLNFRVSPVEVRYTYLAKDKNNIEIEKERKVSDLKNIETVTYMNKYLFDLATDFLNGLYK